MGVPTHISPSLPELAPSGGAANVVTSIQQNDIAPTHSSHCLLVRPARFGSPPSSGSDGPMVLGRRTAASFAPPGLHGLGLGIRSGSAPFTETFTAKRSLTTPDGERSSAAGDGEDSSTVGGALRASETWGAFESGARSAGRGRPMWT